MRKINKELNEIIKEEISIKLNFWWFVTLGMMILAKIKGIITVSWFVTLWPLWLPVAAVISVFILLSVILFTLVVFKGLIG